MKSNINLKKAFGLSFQTREAMDLLCRPRIANRKIRFNFQIDNADTTQLDNFSKLHSLLKEVISVTSNYDSMTWEEQTAFLKNLVKDITALRWQLEKGPNPEVEQACIQVLLPFGVRGLFEVLDDKHRQLFMSVTASCSSLFPQAKGHVHKLIHENLTEWCNFLQSISVGDVDFDILYHRTQVIHTLLEFQLGRDVLGLHWENVVDSLIILLKNGMTLLKMDTDKENLLLLQIILKTTLSYLCKFQSKLKQLLFDNSSECPFRVQKQLETLYGYCMQMYQNISLPMECKYLGGMLATFLLNQYHSDAKEVAIYIKECWFGNIKNLHIGKSPLSFHQYPCNVFRHHDKESQLSLVRGLVSNVQIDALFTNFQLENSVFSNGASTTSLVEIMFPIIMNICENPSDATSKTVAFETFGSLITLITRCHSICENIQKVINVQSLIDVIWKNWEDPIPLFQHKILSFFEAVLEFIQKTGSLSEIDISERLFEKLWMTSNHVKQKFSFLLVIAQKSSPTLLSTLQIHFFDHCFSALKDIGIAPKASACLITFIKCCKKHGISGWESSFTYHITAILSSLNPLWWKNMMNFLIPSFIKINTSGISLIISAIEDASSSMNSLFKTKCLLSVMRVAKTNGITEIPRGMTALFEQSLFGIDEQQRSDAFAILIESKKVNAYLSSQELFSVRKYLTLSCNCQSADYRQQLLGQTIRLLTRIRNSMYFVHKELMQSSNKANSRKNNSDLVESYKEAIEANKEFMTWFVHFSFASLYPGSSFHRLLTVLGLLDIIIQVFGIQETPLPEGYIYPSQDRPTFPFQLEIASPRHTWTLLSCLDSSFQSVRDLSLKILNSFPHPLPGFESELSVTNHFLRSLMLVNSLKGSESDGGAAHFQILYSRMDDGDNSWLKPLVPTCLKETNLHGKVLFLRIILHHLQKQVTIGKSNLLLASQQAPMHGLLTCLRLLILTVDYRCLTVVTHRDQWLDLHRQIIASIKSVLDVVLGPLCDSSPEGNLPENYKDLIGIEDYNHLDHGSPHHQLILSCCWRALREASSLLATVLTKSLISIHEHENFVSFDDIQEGGRLFSELLMNLRHSGAFSSVYPNFTELCTFLYEQHDNCMRDIPKNWLKESLMIIQEKKDISITRRSGGWPYYVLALLSSADSLQRRSLLESLVMKPLFEVASKKLPSEISDTTTLPQVVGFNTLKGIFQDSRIGPDAINFVGDGFILCLDGFSSPSWTIRNCSMMLFSSLVKRVFGTKRAQTSSPSDEKISGKEFFSRFPSLYSYLQRCLASINANFDKNERLLSASLYPILMLLSKLRTSDVDHLNPATSLEPFIPLIMKCGSSPVLKVRKLVADTLVHYIEETKISMLLHSLCHCLCISKQNRLHGQLLQIICLIRYIVLHWKEKKEYELLLSGLNQYFPKFKELMSSANPCNITRASAMKCIQIIVEALDEKNAIYPADETVLQEVRNQCWKEVVCLNPTSSKSLGGSEVISELLKISTMSWKKNNNEFCFDASVFTSAPYEVKEFFLSSALHGKMKPARVESLVLLCVKRLLSGEESHNNCIKLMWSLISNTMDGSFISSLFTNDETIHSLWKHLYGYAECGPLSLKVEAIPVMTKILLILLEKFDNSLSKTLGKSIVESMLCQWIGLVEKFSSEEMPLPVREGISNSWATLCHSEWVQATLRDSIQWYPCQWKATFLSCFMSTTILLLQDDDGCIREQIGSALSYCLHLKIEVMPEYALLHFLSFLKRNVHPDLVIPFVLRALQKDLQSIPVENGETVAEAYQLFEHESPNMYREPLLHSFLLLSCFSPILTNPDLKSVNDLCDVALSHLHRFQARITGANDTINFLLLKDSTTFHQFGTLLTILFFFNRLQGHSSSKLTEFLTLLLQSSKVPPLLAELCKNSFAQTPNSLDKRNSLKFSLVYPFDNNCADGFI